GTGLGLATVYGIVKQAGGFVQVGSQPARGTTFRVYFPRAARGRAGAALPPAAAPGARPGRETVLVVEDEHAVRQLARQVLQTSGYTVLTADHGEEALTVAAGHGGPIHLLLTDLVMPRMNGRQLAEELGRFRPGVKVVFMSGY